MHGLHHLIDAAVVVEESFFHASVGLLFALTSR
jgi:hypothetical protein